MIDGTIWNICRKQSVEVHSLVHRLWCLNNWYYTTVTNSSSLNVISSSAVNPTTNKAYSWRFEAINRECGQMCYQVILSKNILCLMWSVLFLNSAQRSHFLQMIMFEYVIVWFQTRLCVLIAIAKYLTPFVSHVQEGFETISSIWRFCAQCANWLRGIADGSVERLLRKTSTAAFL